MRTITRCVVIVPFFLLLAAPLMAGTIDLTKLNFSYGSGINAGSYDATVSGSSAVINPMSVTYIDQGVTKGFTIQATLTENDHTVTLTGLTLTCTTGPCSVGINWHFDGGHVIVPETTLATVTVAGSGSVTLGQATFAVGAFVYASDTFGNPNNFSLASGDISANGPFSIAPLSDSILYGAGSYTYFVEMSLAIKSLSQGATFTLPSSIDVNVTESVPEPSLILHPGMCFPPCEGGTLPAIIQRR